MTFKDVISKETRVPLAVAGACALAYFAHFQWVDGKFSGVSAEVQELNATVQTQLHGFDKRLALIEAERPISSQLLNTVLDRLIDLEKQAERNGYQYREVLLRINGMSTEDSP